MKKLVITVLVTCSLGVLGCSSMGNNIDNKRNDSIEDATSESVLVETSTSKEFYQEKDFKSIIEDYEKIMELGVSYDDIIDKEINGWVGSYGAIQGEFSSYNNLENYILQSWNSIDDFNMHYRNLGKWNSINNDAIFGDFFINLEGRAYKYISNYRGVHEFIGLVSNIEESNGVVSGQVAYISVDDTIGENISTYNLVNVKFNNKLKLLDYEIVDMGRNIYDDLKNLRENRENLSEEEFNMTKTNLIKIYNSLDKNKECEAVINELNMTTEEYEKDKEKKEKLAALEGNYISEDSSGDEYIDSIIIEIIDEDTLMCTRSINHPILFARSYGGGELKNIENNLWRGKLENGAFRNEWEVELELNDGFLVYKEVSSKLFMNSDDSYINESEKIVYDNPEKVRFNKK